MPPFNGSGTYIRPAGQPVVAGTDILDTTFNTYTADVATALTDCVTRDGQSPATANIPMGGFKITGLAAGTGAGDSIRFDEYNAYITANNSAIALKVGKTSATGSAVLPSSTTANRDVTPLVGYMRYNTDLQQYEGYGSAGWGKIGGGTSGGSTDAAVYENDALVTTSYTLGQASLISGATVTIATPGVVTLTGHGFIANQPVFFQTTGALPTGLSVDTAYYVISTGLTADAFQLSLTSGGAAINTTGTQSGVHSCGKIKNGVSAGPFTVNTGAVWTVPIGARHTIV